VIDVNKVKSESLFERKRTRREKKVCALNVRSPLPLLLHQKDHRTDAHRQEQRWQQSFDARSTTSGHRRSRSGRSGALLSVPSRAPLGCTRTARAFIDIIVAHRRRPAAPCRAAIANTIDAVHRLCHHQKKQEYRHRAQTHLVERKRKCSSSPSAMRLYSRSNIRRNSIPLDMLNGTLGPVFDDNRKHVALPMRNLSIDKQQNRVEIECPFCPWNYVDSIPLRRTWRIFVLFVILRSFVDGIASVSHPVI
jgi:hypothetical protein